VTRPAAGPAAGTRHGLMLTVLMSAMFMAQFDFFVVNVAAPDLQHDLHATEGALQLVVGGYAFAYGGAMIIGGRLGDLLGHRRLFVHGTLGFAITSLLCALAASPAELVVARLAQGFTGALMIPQILALITATFPPDERGRSLGWYSAAAGLGSIAGQVLGGLLVDADIAGLGWRVIFLVNVPIGAVVAPVAARALPERRERGRVSLDPLGAVGVAVAVSLVLIPLTVGRTQGWPAWTWLSLAAAAPAGAVTLAWERVLQRRGSTPMLELSLLRNGSFAGGLIAAAVYMLSFVSLMFALTLVLQRGLGLDPLEAGLVFAPMGVSFAAAALAVRVIARRHADRVALTGSLVSTAGLAMLVACLAARGDATPVGWIALALFVTGAGNGLVHPSILGIALKGVPASHAGAGSGMVVTAQQLAGSVGVAAFGAVFYAALHAYGGVDRYASAMEWTTGLCMVAMLAFSAIVYANARPPAAGHARREREPCDP
jgi:EmrB/QacA subfamily drug resistance transporter